MKASLKIEAVGDNVRQLMRGCKNMLEEVEGLGDAVIGKIPFSYWVARITGPDQKYKYRREFLKAQKDYKLANSTGSRGVFLYFWLETGNVYDVKTSKHRYFCKVTDDGDIVEVDKGYVDEWIKGHWELPY